MTNGRQLRRLAVTVLSVLTLAFAGLQLWGGTDGPAATAAGTGPVLPTSSSSSPTSPSVTSPTVERTVTTPSRVPGAVTLAFAGDVNFQERTADRLAANPATVFGEAAPGLAAADLTAVNLETAIATGGEPEPKSFTFRAPPAALDALRDAGVDVASMANNHAADYGAEGIAESLAAIRSSGFPVIGFGATATAATAPYRTRIGGVPVTIFAASQVPDRTLNVWTATENRPGIASATDPALVDRVRSAATAGETVIVFLHWGTEYVSCPDRAQQELADQLAAAGATAVVGAHAHVLQGAGWRSDGVYVAYGLSNYLWWRSFGNEQDDNGVLSLTIRDRRVVSSGFAPAHLDGAGVPVPATGAEADRINAEWDAVRTCAGLSAEPPR